MQPIAPGAASLPPAAAAAAFLSAIIFLSDTVETRPYRTVLFAPQESDNLLQLGIAFIDKILRYGLQQNIANSI